MEGPLSPWDDLLMDSVDLVYYLDWRIVETWHYYLTNRVKPLPTSTCLCSSYFRRELMKPPLFFSP